MVPMINTHHCLRCCVLATWIAFLLCANLTFAEPDEDTRDDDIPLMGQKQEQAMDSCRSLES